MELTIRQTKDLLRAYVRSGLGYQGHTPYLEGDPGIGKTAIVGQVAKEFGMKFFPLHLSYREPTDLLGLPYFEMKDGKPTVTRFVPPSFLHYDKDDTVLLFLDELPQGVPTVQNGASQLIHERRVGDVFLPEKTFIVAGGNKATNRANTFPLGAHLKNRIQTINCTVNAEQWVDDVANPLELHEAVVSYIRRSPSMLSKVDPNAPSYPSPRSWTKVGEGLNCKPSLPGFVEAAMIHGELGKETAAMFMSHMQIYRGLRDPEKIIADPKRCDLPKGPNGPAIMWSEVTMLARRASKVNIDAICTYFGRLDPEMGTVGMRDILRRDPKEKDDKGRSINGEALLAGSKAGRDWLMANGDLIRSANA
jgi:hypothetical protein